MRGLRAFARDGADLGEAESATFTAFLTFPGSELCVPCGFAPAVHLLCAQGDDPADVVSLGVRRLSDSGDRRVPVWEFDDVRLRYGLGSGQRLTFSLWVNGMPFRTNVLVLEDRSGRDSIVGEPANAIAVDPRLKGSVAAINGVHFHDHGSRSGGRLVDIEATLAVGNRSPVAAGTRGSSPEDAPTIWLMSAKNDAVGERRMRGVPVPQSDGGQQVTFRGVELEASESPHDQLHFWIEVEGRLIRSSFWTYCPQWRQSLPSPQIIIGNCEGS